ncbi:sulfotransferase [Lacinutrix gracilariae]|uniref:Sulfotransferase n=1 Tax=Lacinutrix gracilariae TaxID=1747198 RepID=A0ABW5JZX3_9FLAO
MSKVIILLGQRVRSGTNFVGSTMAMHPDVVTLPPNKSLGEFNLFYDNAIIDNVFIKVAQKSFGLEVSVKEQDGFLKLYGASWLQLLIKKYAIKEDQIIFIKSPVIHTINLWEKTFPESQIAVIYRDGRDNVISSVKASNDNRNWHTFSIKLKKRWNYYSGRSFINHTKDWVVTANKVASIANTKQVQKFKYEDLNNSEENIEKLLQHFKLRCNADILNACLQAPVVGSSFGIDTKKMAKPNWTPETDKSKFKFSNKWNHWKFFKKAVFKYLAGKELIVLEYEKDNKW